MLTAEEDPLVLSRFSETVPHFRDPSRRFKHVGPTRKVWAGQPECRGKRKAFPERIADDHLRKAVTAAAGNTVHQSTVKVAISGLSLCGGYVIVEESLKKNRGQ
ncbi:MAG: hypothetical protein STSR0007_03480 [Thermovirga sp.]